MTRHLALVVAMVVLQPVVDAADSSVLAGDPLLAPVMEPWQRWLAEEVPTVREQFATGSLTPTLPGRQVIAAFEAGAKSAGEGSATGLTDWQTSATLMRRAAEWRMDVDTRTTGTQTLTDTFYGDGKAVAVVDPDLKALLLADTLEFLPTATPRGWHDWVAEATSPRILRVPPAYLTRLKPLVLPARNREWQADWREMASENTGAEGAAPPVVRFYLLAAPGDPQRGLRIATVTRVDESAMISLTAWEDWAGDTDGVGRRPMRVWSASWRDLPASDNPPFATLLERAMETAPVGFRWLAVRHREMPESVADDAVRPRPGVEFKYYADSLRLLETFPETDGVAFTNPDWVGGAVPKSRLEPLTFYRDSTRDRH